MSYSIHMQHLCRLQNDPEYALAEAKSNYDFVRAGHKAAHITEQAADHWIEDLNAAADRINDVYRRFPHLIGK